MSQSPETKKNKKNKGLHDLMNNNKFVLVISVIIAFFVWVAVAMYKSPEESYTIYNVPITIDTENSIVSQKGYVNFWQSDEAIDVTVTGPRYLITSLTADDIIVSANLNTVDAAGVFDLALKVSLKEESQDISISAQSKTAVEVYFDTQCEKQFDIVIDSNVIPDHVAQGYQFSSAELTVSTVTLKGPETEINKVVSVVADPQFSEELMFKTDTVPVELNLEGATAAETVSVNKYVEIIDSQEYFVKISIDRIAQLKPEIEFTGTQTGAVSVSFSTETVNATVATETELQEDELTVMTLDYSDLEEGINSFRVTLSELELPEGITVNEPDTIIYITVTLVS